MHNQKLTARRIADLPVRYSALPAIRDHTKSARERAKIKARRKQKHR